MENINVCFKDRLARCGTLQVVLGIICGIVSLAAIGIDGKNFKILGGGNEDIRNTSPAAIGIDDKNFKRLGGGNEDIRNTIIGLDVASLLSSLGIIYTGLIPLKSWACFSSEKFPDFIRMKITFMVFSATACSLFAPVVLGAGIANFFLRGHDIESNHGLMVASVLFSTIEFLVAIVACACCCCYTPWWLYPENAGECNFYKNVNDYSDMLGSFEKGGKFDNPIVKIGKANNKEAEKEMKIPLAYDGN